jgi:hypothetical protein
MTLEARFGRPRNASDKIDAGIDLAQREQAGFTG